MFYLRAEPSKSYLALKRASASRGYRRGFSNSLRTGGRRETMQSGLASPRTFAKKPAKACVNTRPWVTEIVLQRFCGLDRIEHIHRQPVVRSLPIEFVKPERFVDYFEDVYASSHEPLQVDRAALAEVPPFTADEVKDATRRMSNARCAKEAGIIAEMIKSHLSLIFIFFEY